MKKTGIASTALLLALAVGAGTVDRRTLTVVSDEAVQKQYLNFWESATLDTPTKKNYDFVGWEDEDGNVSDVKNVSHLLTDKTLTAKFSPKIYTVSYYDNDELICERGYLYGEETPVQTLETNAEQHPYEDFAGWEDCTGTTIPVLVPGNSGDIILYAVYKGKEYEINYELNGGSLANAAESYTYGKGASLIDPTRSGYTFKGWYTNADCSGERVEKISKESHGDITLYAKWEKIPKVTVQNSYSSYGGKQSYSYVSSSGNSTSGGTSSSGSVSSSTSDSSYSAPVYATNMVYCGSYSATIVNGNSQSIVDAQGQCAYFNFLGLPVLADHAAYGFSQTKVCNTLTAFGRTYTCISRAQGSNTGHGIMLDDGQWFEEVGLAMGAALCTYTCNDSAGTSVTVSYWR